MKTHRTTLLLFCIVFLAGILRFWHISSDPPSLYWDEVSQGYNAYSILKTGRDEHQEFLPLARFVAYGDYKAPVYIYLDVPFIALLGKTSLAVRFPSALFGTLTVLVTFFLIRELFFSERKKTLFALGGAFFLAISPWHIQLSRVAYEGNIATFFSILGIYLFFLAKRKNAWMYILSGISFTIGIYAFNGFRVFIPMLGLLLVILYFKELSKQKLIILLTGIICFILFIPFLQFLRTPESKLRYYEVNIFSDSKVILKANKDIQDEGNTVLAKVVHNRRVAFSLLYVKHYLDFFNPDFLFIHGDVNPRFSLQENGELYLWELPLILLGIYFLCVKKGKEAVLLFSWFLIAPIAAATARETPHALRGETFIPVYDIFSGIGVVYLSSLLKKYNQRLRFVLGGVGVGVICLSIFLFIYNYSIDYPYLYSQEWQYGYKSAIATSESLESHYDKIIFTNAYGRAYMYLLFYSQMTPQSFWKSGIVTKDQFGLYNVPAVGKYVFPDDMNTVQTKKGEKVLYVVSPSELKPDMKVFDTVYLLDGKPGFLFATK